MNVTATVWAADDSSLVNAVKYAMHAKGVVATCTDWVVQLHFEANGAICPLTTGVTATPPFPFVITATVHGHFLSISLVNWSLSRHYLAAYEGVKLGPEEAQTCRHQVAEATLFSPA